MMIYLYETLYLKATLSAVAGSRGKIILSAAIFYIRWTVLSMFSCTNLQCNVYIAMFIGHSLSRVNLMGFLFAFCGHHLESCYCLWSR